MSTFDAAYRTTLAPAAEFVLLGARTSLEGAQKERFESLLAQSLDWEMAIALASSHRVLGLLGRHLSARHFRDVPDAAREVIQNYFRDIALHSAALKNELAEVSHALESAGIPVVSFKGPTLAFGVYGNAVVRPSADLDLLVSRHDVLPAREILRAAGYVPETELSPAQEQIHLRIDSVFNLARPATGAISEVMPEGFAVELHWAITSPCLPFDLEYETVEAHLGSLKLPGVDRKKADVRALSPEDLLLILCVHGAKHLWERLIWVCDVAELIEKTPQMDWQRVMRQARERGVLRMTILGLALARDVLGASLPIPVLAWFTTQPEALRIAARLRASLLAPAPIESLNGELTHNPSTNGLLMQTIDAPLKRMGFLWHVATTPSMEERAGARFSPRFDFWWRVLRPARIAMKHWPLKRSHS